MKMKNKENGITLIALVVTIIVLLILAGITVQVVLQGGIIGEANRAKVLTEISTIEEAANVIYADLKIKKQQGEISKISMLDIVNELNKQNYKIEVREIGGNNINGITANPKRLTLIENEVAMIKISFDIAEEKYLYYAIINGKYYKMNITDSGVIVERKEEELEGEIVGQNAKIEIENGYDLEIIKNIEIKDDKITLIAGEKSGTTSLIIRYGKYFTTCIVNIAPKATKITATSLNLIEGENKEISIVVEPDNAKVVPIYTTDDTDKIDINDTGMVTAKTVLNNKIKDKAVVKIKDKRTGLIVDCDIIIESLIGTFIEYDVSYIDVGKEYEYSKENGWRLLKYTKNSNNTYSNIELISTGIPARLNLDWYSDDKNWWVTATETAVTPNLVTFNNNILR